MKHKRLIIASVVILIVLIALSGALYIYVSDFYRAQAGAAAILADDSAGLAVFDGGIAIGSPAAEKGFIFYPGGKVEYTAYLPLLQKISDGGVFCVAVKMPFNLAVFDANAAARIMDDYPEIKQWSIGGHSLGGAMAAVYAADNQDRLAGLVLLAAYPTKDLKASGLSVLSLYGSEDGVLNFDKYTDALGLMPENFREVRIEGGNHAQFGDYGLQAGDGQALVSAGEQLAITAGEIFEFIEKLDARP